MQIAVVLKRQVVSPHSSIKLTHNIMIREKYLNFYDSSETTLAEKGAEVFTVPSLKQFFECILALTKAPLSILCRLWFSTCLENGP